MPPNKIETSEKERGNNMATSTGKHGRPPECQLVTGPYPLPPTVFGAKPRFWFVQLVRRN